MPLLVCIYHSNRRASPTFARLAQPCTSEKQRNRRSSYLCTHATGYTNNVLGGTLTSPRKAASSSPGAPLHSRIHAPLPLLHPRLLLDAQSRSLSLSLSEPLSSSSSDDRSPLPSLQLLHTQNNISYVTNTPPAPVQHAHHTRPRRTHPMPMQHPGSRPMNRYCTCSSSRRRRKLCTEERRPPRARATGRHRPRKCITDRAARETRRAALGAPRPLYSVRESRGGSPGTPCAAITGRPAAARPCVRVYVGVSALAHISEPERESHRATCCCARE